MARLQYLQSFDPAKPVIVRRAFTGSGRHYSPGDEFHWKRLGVDRRRVRLLFEAGKLRHHAPSEAIAVTDGSARASDPGQDGPGPEPAPPIVNVSNIPVSGRSNTPVEADDLDEMGMPDLRKIAADEGVPFKVSKADMREAIRAHRRGE